MQLLFLKILVLLNFFTFWLSYYTLPLEHMHNLYQCFLKASIIEFFFVLDQWERCDQP